MNARKKMHHTERQSPVFVDFLNTYGRITWLANEINVTPQAVWRWKRNGVPEQRARAVARITRLRLRDIRPDWFAPIQQKD